MKIAICGYNGFLGKNIVNHFCQLGYEFILISRDDLIRADVLISKIRDVDYVLNFSGASVAKRWTKNYKRVLYDSRIGVVNKLILAIEESGNEKCFFIIASAIGIYDNYKIQSEINFSYGSDYLATLVSGWENTVIFSGFDKERFAILRLGVVLDKSGGYLQKVLSGLPFKTYLQIGSDAACISFIDMYDFLQALTFIVENKLNGITNIVAPNYVSQIEIKNIVTTRFKPWFAFRIPDFVLKLMFGEAFYFLLSSPKVIPERLLKLGFKFKCNTFDNSINRNFGINKSY